MPQLIRRCLCTFLLCLLLPPIIPKLTAQQSDVVINELMASNSAAVADDAGEYDDWLELYNNGSSSADLSGYFITDKTDNLTKWPIPQGTVLSAKAYLIVWADEDGGQGDFHANFKLSAVGETLMLIDPDTQIVDQVTWTQLPTDSAYARVPNGTGNFMMQTHTFAAKNDGTTSWELSFGSEGIRIYPNPAAKWVHVDLGDRHNGRDMMICNSLGQLVYGRRHGTHINIDVSGWESGIYYLRAGDQVRPLWVQP